jgi:hypothetical protein
VNWHLVGTVAAGTPDHWSNGRSTPVADAVMNDGSANYVAFVATGRADHWGVRNVTLSATG